MLFILNLDLIYFVSFLSLLDNLLFPEFLLNFKLLFLIFQILLFLLLLCTYHSLFVIPLNLEVESAKSLFHLKKMLFLFIHLFNICFVCLHVHGFLLVNAVHKQLTTCYQGRFQLHKTILVII